MTTPTELPKYRERVAIEESIAVGWAVTKKRFLPIFLYTSLALFLAFLPSALAAMAHDFLERNILFVLLLSLVTVVFVSVSTLGIIKMNIAFKRGQDFTFDDFLSVGNCLLNYVGAIILSAIVVGTGLLFFIIPGIIFAIRLSVTDYFIVDRKMGPLQAMSASWTATRGCVGMLILFAGTMQLLMTLGTLVLVIGMIPAYMVMMVARAQVYDRLVDTCPELALPEPTEGTSITISSATTPDIASSAAPEIVPATEPTEVVTATAATATPVDIKPAVTEPASPVEPLSEPKISSEPIV
jgi:hypothetical protein